MLLCTLGRAFGGAYAFQRAVAIHEGLRSPTLRQRHSKMQASNVAPVNEATAHS